jgi:hypothetical protein
VKVIDVHRVSGCCCQVAVGSRRLDAVLGCQQHERRLDNHRNKKTNSWTLRRCLDSGFAERFWDMLGVRSGLAMRNIAWSPITFMLSTGFEVRNKCFRKAPVISVTLDALLPNPPLRLINRNQTMQIGVS